MTLREIAKLLNATVCIGESRLDEEVEHAFAIATGIVVYYDDELYADGTLRGKAYDEHRLPEVAP